MKPPVRHLPQHSLTTRNVRSWERRQLSVTSPRLQCASGSGFSLYLKLFSQLSHVKRYNGSITQVVGQLKQQTPFVMLLHLNAAYVEMTKSFLCNLNMVSSGTHFTAKLVLIASDPRAFEEINGFLKIEPLHNLVGAFSPTVLRDFRGLNHNLDFGTKEYYRLTLFRLLLQNQLIQANYDVLIIEADAVWLSPHIHSILQEAIMAPIDIISANDSGGSADKLISAGFLLVKANARVKKFFNLYTRRYRTLLSKKQLMGEQILMTHMLQGGAEIYVKWLDECDFASGRWYSDQQYRKRCPAPKVIQNNWIMGNSKKKERSKSWGHWFLTRNGTCMIHF